MKRYICSLFCLYTLFIAVALQGCKDKNDEIDGIREGWLRVIPLSLEFDAATTSAQAIYLVTTEDMDLEKITFEVEDKGKDWCSVVRKENELFISVKPSYYLQPRATVVKVSYEEVVREIPVTQKASSGATGSKVKVIGATATSEETVSEPRGIDKSYDGKYDTYFNSKFGAITQWPFFIEYKLETPNTLDRVIYYPRSDSGNKWGSFNEYDLWISTTENPEFVKVGTYARGDGNHEVTTMKMQDVYENVEKVRFEIYSAFQNRISCSEMEFYGKDDNTYDYSQIFANELCTEIKAGVTEADILKIPNSDYKKLALALFFKAYNTEYRHAEYRPYQNPAVQAAVNKTSPYSLRDNPTGIYVDKEEELLILVENPGQQSISMVVQDLSVGYGSSKSYPLFEGENRIKVQDGGLVYIQNLTQDDIPLIAETDAAKKQIAQKSVKVHFVFGKVNGYFDAARHTAEDWKIILRDATYQDIDIIGKYAHITWTTKDFRNYNTDIVSVIEKYDRLVYLQQEFMGLEKYNKMFKNRMYFHIDYNSSNPYATSNRTAYNSSYAEIFCNANRFEVRLWGPAHEVGHCNQTRPGLKWAGTTEVTNNIHSMYVQQQFGVESKLLVDDFYKTATEEIINKGKPHCLENASNQFEIKLVPFWQLKLYLVDALGQEDFYRDLYEYYRVTDDLDTSTTTEGILQLDFVRQVCRISGLDLLDFFAKWGFLTAVETTINDYGNKPFKITQEQIDALIKEIKAKNYKKPHENVHQITEVNIGDYRK